MISEYLEPISKFLEDLIIQVGYPGILLATFIENIIAPIPSEFVFPLAGFLAGQGKMNIWLIALAGAVGSVLAAWVLYYLGTRFNGPKTREFVDKYGKWVFVSLSDLERAEKWFTKYGVWTVLLFRIIPIGRTIVSIPAGFIKMNFWIFTLFTFVGTFAWSFILAYAGYLLGDNWNEVSSFISGYEHYVIYAGILAVLIFIFIKRKSIPYIGKWL